jgi:uncharacterized protein (DUF2147 family)
MNSIYADDILGSWMSEGWRFRLEISVKNGVYSGVLAEGLENGELDAANPDPSRRTLPLLGSTLFDGLRFRNGTWKGGKLYNPENGKYYSMNLSPGKNGRLEMRAFIGVPLIGMTQYWEILGYRKDLDATEIEKEAGISHGQAWTAERANKWYTGRPWPVGCNFIPSSAINQLEMWQAETFSPELIARELGLARALGFSCLRVYLHNIPWKLDRAGFVSRISSFLDISGKAGLSTIFVLFDDCWNDNPRPGKQKAPRAGIHNSGWVRSPGSRLINNEKNWNELESFVRGVIGEFRADERIYAWDLYNEIGNSAGFLPNSTRLLARTFRWAREAKPDQPLTAGIWKGSSWFTLLNEFLARNSDIISFHDYSPKETLVKKIDALSVYGKPLICTEYMARTQPFCKPSACLPRQKGRSSQLGSRGRKNTDHLPMGFTARSERAGRLVSRYFQGKRNALVSAGDCGDKSHNGANLERKISAREGHGIQQKARKDSPHIRSFGGMGKTCAKHGKKNEENRDTACK